MKHTTALVAAIGLATTVAAANTPTSNHRDAVNKRSVSASVSQNMKRDTAHQQDSKRVEPRSPLRYAYPGPSVDEPSPSSTIDEDGDGRSTKDKVVDAGVGIATDYVRDRYNIPLAKRDVRTDSEGAPGLQKRQWGRNSGSSNRGGSNPWDTVRRVDGYAEDLGVSRPWGSFKEKRSLSKRQWGRTGSGSGRSNSNPWDTVRRVDGYAEDLGISRPWGSSRKRDISVDEVVEEVLDKLNGEETKSEDDTAETLKEIVEDAAKEDDDTSISDVVKALAEASDDGDSKSKDDSADTIEDILDAVSSDDKDDHREKDEETLAEKIEDLVDGDSSDSKSSHGDTLEEKLEELEKETSDLDKDDPKAEMIEELIDELIDEAATLDEIPVEYFHYWMAVQSCLDPVHLLTTKGLMASHLSRRGTTPIVVAPTKTVEKREDKPAEVLHGLVQPFGAEMAQTSGAGERLSGRGTVGFLVIGAAVAMLAGSVAF